MQALFGEQVEMHKNAQHEKGAWTRFLYHEIGVQAIGVQGIRVQAATVLGAQAIGIGIGHRHRHRP